MILLNPDHFLETADGRVFTIERNRTAWDKCFILLDRYLEQNIADKLYIMIGCQASGKSTWAQQQYQLQKRIIIFDALLVQQIERQILLKQTKNYDLKCIAVWMDTPLALCLRRNQLRPIGERISESGLRHVFHLLEPPTLAEGFDSIIRIRSKT